MLDRSTVRELLVPFDIFLPDATIDKVLTYLELLGRWNRKINLTAIEEPRECVTRHFAESFLLSKLVQPSGRLLDVGSGAGFPGLAIKLIVAGLEVVLLEPVAKKRAFLKEAARMCGMSHVRVLGTRLEEFAHTEEPKSFDFVTVRAVGGLDRLVPKVSVLLSPGGYLCLWVGGQQISAISDSTPEVRWQNPMKIPLSDDRYIMAGRRST